MKKKKDTKVIDGIQQCAGERARAFCTEKNTKESEAKEPNTH